MDKLQEIALWVNNLPTGFREPVIMMLVILMVTALITLLFSRHKFIKAVSSPIYASSKFDYETSVALSATLLGLLTLPFIVLPIESLWLAWFQDFWGIPLEHVSELVKSFPVMVATVLMVRHAYRLPQILMSPSPACTYIKEGTDTRSMIKALQVFILGLGAIALIQEAGQDISLALGFGAGISAALILAAAPVFSNVVSYFTLLFGQVFAIEDHIEIVGKDGGIVSGVVQGIGFIDTELDSDGNKIVIPNRLFNDSAVVVKNAEVEEAPEPTPPKGRNRGA